MNRNLINVGFAFLLFLVIVGGVWLFKFQESGKSIEVAGDDYPGYAIIRSAEMKKQASQRGLKVSFSNDHGDYAGRLKGFNEGKYYAIVLPVNSYLQHGLQYNYPGVIVAAIAKSNGADAILAFPPIEKVKDLNDQKLKFVYTKDSPSSFLVGLTRTDFGLDNLSATEAWKHEVTGGSPEVYELAKKHQGNAFVMWEPDVTRAVNDIPGIKVVWDSSKFNGYIEDVFVFRRDYVQNHRSDCVKFFEAYFTAMRTYKANNVNHARLVKEMMDMSGCKEQLVEAMAQKIDWHGLEDNYARQFGLATERKADGILNCIAACTNVMVRTKDLKSDPLSDPKTIIDGSILQEVHDHMLAAVGDDAVAQREFRELTAEEWKSLKELGVMRVEPIDFLQGESDLDPDAQKQIDEYAKLLANNYPDARVVVKGHTGPSVDGDDTENIKLSQARADAVVQRLIAEHVASDGKTALPALSANRFHAVGCGSSEPPARKSGENRLTYGRRKQRVEFWLYADGI